MANKVEFGISNLHFCTYTVADDGTVTLGTPLAVAGAVSLELEPEGDQNTFNADNTAYWSSFSDNGFSGSINVAKFPDAFKKAFMGYVELDDGGIGQLKGVTKPAVCVMFQSEGDAESRRGILYNVSLGNIQRAYNTTEDTITPDTETVDITVIGDNATKLTRVGYGETATGYATLFTNPPVPTLPTSL